ncbi:MAG: shikimate kinase [Eubacteriales bacterium]|nr:shikimate kinase [Eubacteriales bacterium]
MNCGLLGRVLGHSYSPQIHAMLGDYPYSLFEKEPDEVGDFLKNGDFTGINVTIPYKKTVIPFLDELTPAAEKMGAVNTVVRRPDGALLGHNTDYFGFVSLVQHSGIPVQGRKALVLGSGGASGTAVQALRDLGATPIVISRSGENNYGNLCRHADACLIVNATPVGMYPKNGVSPLDLAAFPHLEGVLDVIYNPAKTRLLLDAEALGIPGENGLWMLVAQAKEAAEYFTGQPISDAVIAPIHRRLSVQMKNIALVGMPGCGKTTVGRQLAQRLGRKFVDLDDELVKDAGCSIPDIFAREGEDGFRARETAVLERFSRESGLVLATGGGCVTQAENLPLLWQNSTVCWLQRDTAALATDGRPLSQGGKLEEMYRIRRPLYEKAADLTVQSDENAAEAIAARLEETL